MVHRDREGKITRTFYDALRRVTAVRDPLGRTTTQSWCGCGSLDKLIDAKGQSTTWERDAQGRVTREIRADGTTDTDYIYETTTSRLKSATDPKGQVTTYTYAVDDRMIQTAFTNETVATPDISFTHDPNYSRLSTMTDGVGTTTYAYRAPGTAGAGRLASIDGPLTDDTIAITYDDLSRATSRLLNGYGIVSLAYDALGRLTQEENELGKFIYDHDGVTSRLESITYPNGQTSTFSYFGNSGDRRLQTIHHATSTSVTLSKFDYTYGADGNLLTWRQQTGPNAIVWEYGYDTTEQLTRAVKKTTDPTPGILKRQSYTYDLAGNRTVEQIDSTVVGATYNNLNRLTSQQPNGVVQVVGMLNEAGTVTIEGQPARVSSTNVFEGTTTIASGTSTFTVTATDTNNNSTSKTYELANTGASNTLTYDANGNLTTDGAQSFEWDARNQLVAVTVGTHRSEFTYDGQLRRVRTVEKENGVTQTDTWHVWCDDDAICEDRASDGTTVIRRAFRHGELISGAAHFFVTDHLTSVTDVTDSTQSVLARYSFDPWGKRTLVEGTNVTQQAFTGVALHAPTDLLLMKRRTYNAQTARWLSDDPWGMIDGPNLYLYVANQPLRWIDPEGTTAVYVKQPSWSQPNGNVGKWYDEQEQKCTGLSILGWNGSQCTLSCCQDHDDCYRNQRCNMTSWATIAWDSACTTCNRSVAKCILIAVPVYHLCREVCGDK